MKRLGLFALFGGVADDLPAQVDVPATDNRRFSAHAAIDRGTVGRLVLRRVLQTGSARVAGLATVPVVTAGRMYVTTAWGEVIAYDLRRGRELWRYAPRLASHMGCCGPVNRGVTLGHELVFLATLDARVVALDQRSGAVRWDVQDSEPDSGYGFTAAPLLAGGTVIVGTAGGEFPTRGRVSAYEASTGRRVWRWFAIPSPTEGGWWGRWTNTTPAGEPLGRDVVRERADSARFSEAWRIGGGAVWTTPAYDAALGAVILGVGNPAPSFDGAVRPGDNLHTTSIVALGAATGRLRWAHQYVPHDLWDSDAANPPVLIRRGGRRLVAHAGKTGWVHLFDAASGAPLRRSEALVPQERFFQPPSVAGIERSPGPLGGANWQPSAYSPRTGLLYVPVVHEPRAYLRAPTPLKPGRGYRGGTTRRLPGRTTWAALVAVDPVAGRIRWRHQLPRQSHQPGGALAIAGGLVFAGDADGIFRAYDDRTGGILWEFFCGAGVAGAPMSFMLDGEQFIAVAAGGSRVGGRLGDAILIFGAPRPWRAGRW